MAKCDVCQTATARNFVDGGESYVCDGCLIAYNNGKAENPAWLVDANDPVPAPPARFNQRPPGVSRPGCLHCGLDATHTALTRGAPVQMCTECFDEHTVPCRACGTYPTRSAAYLSPAVGPRANDPERYWLCPDCYKGVPVPAKARKRVNVDRPNKNPGQVRSNTALMARRTAMAEIREILKTDPFA